jgi:probable lipoprotein NlpC
MIGPPRWAERYVGISFNERGFDFSGCHCWGLAVLVYRFELKIDLPRYDVISAGALRKIASTIADARTFGPWLLVTDQSDFDVILMRAHHVDERGINVAIAHIGIAAGPGHVLHVQRGSESACVPLAHESIKRRNAIVARYRHEASPHARDHSAIATGSAGPLAQNAV